ncbi:hypothetical protein GOP47_0023262 [Adiantum capillus-veneris]|uniref:Uncharacterized protein n=1 Tax=Adiantum capillus-veneris TaxID=13818 RepID=A0A9D4Z523_ADICA|nr:hypothetical protein GOP47_0023262 [Adiantum capillus-veneris]
MAHPVIWPPLQALLFSSSAAHSSRWSSGGPSQALPLSSLSTMPPPHCSAALLTPPFLPRQLGESHATSGSSFNQAALQCLPLQSSLGEPKHWWPLSPSLGGPRPRPSGDPVFLLC